MPRPTIAQVFTAPPTSTGGLQRYMQYLLAMARDAGLGAVAYAGYAADPDAPAREDSWQGIPVIESPLFSRAYLAELSKAPADVQDRARERLKEWLKQDLRKRNVQLLHIHDMQNEEARIASEACKQAADELGIKTVLTVHLPSVAEPVEPIALLEGCAGYAFVSAVGKSLHVEVPNSTVIPGCADSKLFVKTPIPSIDNPDLVTFGFLSRVDEAWKGADVMLRAMEIALTDLAAKRAAGEATPRIRLLLPKPTNRNQAINDATLGRLHDICTELGLTDDDVEFRDVPYSDAPAFMAECDVIVLPSKQAEGLPLALVEALQSGRVTIATLTKGFRGIEGGQSELLKTVYGNHADAMLIAPDSPQDLARVMVLLALNPEIRQFYADLGAEQVQGKFDDGLFKSRYTDFYDTVAPELEFSGGRDHSRGGTRTPDQQIG